MPIKINFNICDNSPECSGKSICPTDAIYWDNESKNALGGMGTLCVDNDKCISCGKCTSDEGCPVGAIVLVDTYQELKLLEQSLVLDNAAIKNLFVERYGAEPIDESICIKSDKISDYLGDEFTIIEEFSEESIQCLLTSIPISSIVKEMENITKCRVDFYKCDCTKINDINQVPRLKIYRNKVLFAEIDGYYNNFQFDSLIEKLKREIRKG